MLNIFKNFLLKFRVGKTEVKRKFSDVFTVSFFTLSAVLFFIPSLVFLTNTGNFSFLYEEIFIFLISITAILTLLFSLILYLLSKHFKTVINISLSFLFTLGFLSWFQANILVWNYGVFDGKPIIWDKYFLQVYADGIIWVFLLILAVRKSDLILKIAKKIPLFLIILQLIYISFLYLRKPETPKFKKYFISESNKYNFSKDKNIIYLIIDTFQGDIFHEIMEEDQNNFKELDGFIFYPDTASSYNSTDLSLPSLLTETEYDGGIAKEQWAKQSYQKCSIMRILKNNSFDVELYPEYPEYITFNENEVSNYIPKTFLYFQNFDFSNVLKLMDVSFFRSSPSLLKIYIYNNQKWRFRNLILAPNSKFSKIDRNFHTISFIRKFEQKVNSTDTNKVFKLYHLFGNHPPYRINRNLEYVEKLKQKVKGYREQTRGMLSLIKIFIKTLKEKNVYDNSLIFIFGDHGVGYSANNSTFDGKIFTKHTAKINNPVLLIKPFNSRGILQISSKRAQLIDLSTTVLSNFKLQSCSSERVNLLDPKLDTSNRIRMNGYYPLELRIDGDVRDAKSWKNINPLKQLK